MAKGQAEFAVIIGIVIVAAVVIIYALPNITNPIIPSGKYGMFKASFESLVRDGAQDTMSRLSAYGGYPDNSSFQLGSVSFLGKEVPYWQKDGSVKYPNVKDNFVQGVSSYLSKNKEGFLQEMKMAGLEIGEPRVSANMLASKIIITVNMPTKIDGTNYPQPYTVEIPSRLGEIEEFSKAFAQYDKNSRPLEYYTLSSMIISPMEEDVHSVPIQIFLTECGEYVFRSWWDIKPSLENVIKATLAQTYMPGKAPLNTMMTSSSPKYSLVPLNGKRYESLDVSFFLPDNFELTPADFQFSPDPIIAISQVIPMVGQCQSDPVYVKYYLSYPAIVRVKDPLTQNVFQFAVHVYIEDNKPGDWSGTGYETDVQKQICSNPQCSADISLKDSLGKPVDYAAVSFMGCSLGRTDSQGILRGPAPCGLGPLQVYKQGYESYGRMQSSDSIRGLSLTLAKTPAIRLHLYEVIVQNISLNGKYDISQDGISPIATNRLVYMNLYDTTNVKAYQRGFSAAGNLLNSMPAGPYIITASLISAGGEELGAILVDYTLSESLDGKDLYVYLPDSLDYGKITDEAEKAGATVTLTNVLTKCGLGPISLSEVNFNGCSVGYNEV